MVKQPSNPVPVETVYCLSIDLIDSTKAGLDRTTHQNDRFNEALVEQINPHLEQLDLESALLKFTGDGWLVMSTVKQLPALCCLALIQARRFQVEMSNLTGIEARKIPRLKIAVCAGRDVSVKLPDGRSDWVGDSARRAVRASGYCGTPDKGEQPNEILVDETVRVAVQRDFDFNEADMSKRTSAKPSEEKLLLHRLEALRAETCAESDAPQHFVYALSVTGMAEQAQKVAERAVDQGAHAIATNSRSTAQIIPGWNAVIRSLQDYSSAVQMLDRIRAHGLKPDLATYAILIKKAPALSAGLELLEAMRQEGLAPNVTTYTTLIGKADLQQGKELLAQMRQEGLAPNVITYTTLIGKADLQQGKELLAQMRQEGLTPNVITYTTLIGKADLQHGKELLAQMRQEGLAPNVITYNSLIDKADLQQGKELLVEMREKGLAPDVITYSSLVNKADFQEGKKLLAEMRDHGLAPDLITYNTLIGKADLQQGKELLVEMREKGLAPDVITYNSLIDKSDLQRGKELLAEMPAAGLAPNVVTYTTLIAKADFQEGRKLLAVMREKGLAPNAITYATLIRTADFEEGKKLVAEMREDGLEPNQIIYASLFQSDLTESAQDLLRWYLAQPNHPYTAIDAAIASYRRLGRIDDALELALAYAHLPGARRLMRENPEGCLVYFKSHLDRDPQHPNADYALGVAYLEQARPKEAQRHLQRALKLATAGPRKTVIRDWLRYLQAAR